MKSLFASFFLAFFSIVTFSQEEQKISIYFDFDSDDPSQIEMAKLDVLKASIVEFTKIQSFSDRSGSVDYNKLLAIRRSKSIIQYLRQGDRPSSIEIIGEEYQTKTYIAKLYRRVDIYYKLTPVNPQPQQNGTSIESRTNPIPVPTANFQHSVLVEKFTAFLKDSIVTEATVVLSVLFIGGEDAFIDPQDPDLWKLFDILHYNEDVTVEIRGHVCCGSNRGLSIMRAHAVYKFLAARSISPDRMHYNGYDNTLPAVTPELTEDDRMKNRRVDVVFHKAN